MTQVRMRWTIRFNHFPRIAAELPAIAERIVAKTAMDLEAHAKTRAPVDTGTLKNSIQAFRVAQGHWRVVVGAEYGMYVEWGTVHMAAQPFFQPAVVAVSGPFRAALREVTRP